MNASRRRFLVLYVQKLLFEITKNNLKEMMIELVNANNVHYPNAECLTHFRYKGSEYGYEITDPYGYINKRLKVNRLHITLVPTLKDYLKRVDEVDSDSKKIDILFSKIFKLSTAGYDVRRCLPNEILNNISTDISFYDNEDYHLRQDDIDKFMEENHEYYSLINQYQLKNLLTL